MKCPFCSHPDLKVTNKRDSPDGVRRRRECKKCGKRFTTYEKIEQNNLFIIKKDGNREKYSREKLEKGIRRALEKRPISEDQINNTINKIEETMRKKGKEVNSNFVGDLIMKKLEKLDKVAYVRFASVYKDFHNIKDFKKELRGL